MKFNRDKRGWWAWTHQHHSTPTLKQKTKEQPNSPRILGLEVICVEAIKNVRKLELYCLEAMVKIVFTRTTSHTHIETLWPPTLFRETWIQIKLDLAHSHFLYNMLQHNIFCIILELFYLCYFYFYFQWLGRHPFLL